VPKQSLAQNREGRDSFMPRRVEVLNPKHQILNNIKIQKSKGKNQNDNSKRKNVVRGFSLVHDPEGSHYKNVEHLRQPG
jgi:hypothetical protein